ncbi:glycosyltransferase family 2 protein [Pseudomonas sp. CGJS7]|uniref:glycosyltransferase family 2 protein n=1 Tax=Pseudomonas sp. CGJS7 TaxID=3109348 RepID=UPI003009A5AE
MDIFIFCPQRASGDADDERQLKAILAARAAAGLESLVLIASGASSGVPEWLSALSGVRIEHLPPKNFDSSTGRGRLPDQGQVSWGDKLWSSRLIMQWLVRYQRDVGPIGYVEFPAAGGLAFASLQERLFRGAFETVEFALRLSGISGVQAARQGVPVSVQDLLLADLERKCAADCDLLLADNHCVGEYFRSYWGFRGDDWAPRFRGRALDLSSKPLTATTDERAGCVVGAVSSERSARLFLRGCVGLLRTRRQWKGRVVLASNAYFAAAMKVVPADLRPRFTVVEVGENSLDADSGGPGDIRLFVDDWAPDSIAVDQALLGGAVCVLNRANPAYAGDSSQTMRGDCLYFDGSLEALVSALASAVDGAPVAVSQPHSPTQVSAAIEATAQRPPAAAKGPSRVSIIVPHFNLGAYLQQTLANALASTHEDLEVVVVDDASTDSRSLEAIRLARALDPRVRVIELEYNRGLAGARNVGVSQATGEYVLPLDADDLIHPEFVAVASRALDRRPAFDFVVPQAAYFSGAGLEAFDDVPIDGCLALVGEARQAGLFANLFSTATCFSRRGMLQSLRYREDLQAYEDWDLYRRAVAAGHRFIVGNEIMFLYRHRADSMIHSPDMRARHARLMSELTAKDSFAANGMPVPAQTLHVVAGATVPGAQGELMSDYSVMLEELRSYRESPAVKAALAMSRYASKYLPGAKRLLRGIRGRG